MIGYKMFNFSLLIKEKSLNFFTLYILIFGTLLWNVGNIDEIKTALQYDYAFNVFLAMLITSTLLPILDLCWSMDYWNTSEIGLSLRMFVYFTGILAAIVLLSQLMADNSLEASEQVLQEGKVNTCFKDTDYNTYKITTQDGVVLHTADVYEYGQKIRYVKSTAIKRVTREPVVYYSSIPKGVLN